VFHTPDGALQAPFAFLCTVPGISRAAATAICSARVADGERVLERVERLGARCLLAGDPEFPAALAAIPDPPTLLFAQGALDLLSQPAVAIVGSRDHSVYGSDVAVMVSTAASRAGVVVVSGMARGLDAVAHAAALDAGGGTIGVLGNGLGVIYPAANRALYERVSVKGLLLTEFPPGERPRVGSFPRRNRLISGLGRVVLVIEAAAGSGTLITVEAALEQGKDVMAVPGAITSATSVGTNRLIRDGAEPLLEGADLLQHYPEVSDQPEQLALQPARREDDLPHGLTPGERDLAILVSREARHLDLLVRDTGRPPGEILALLSGLELAGVVEQLAGWRSRRVST
jgi:DNA processing protein